MRKENESTNRRTQHPQQNPTGKGEYAKDTHRNYSKRSIRKGSFEKKNFLKKNQSFLKDAMRSIALNETFKHSTEKER